MKQKRTKEEALTFLFERKEVLDMAAIARKTGISYLSDAVNKKVNKRVGDKEYITKLNDNHLAALNAAIDFIKGL